MRIVHHCNSFITVKSRESSISCDPWVGKTFENAWLSFPVYKNLKKICEYEKPQFIYISHLHCDHYDPKSLNQYNKDKTTVIIKDFNDKRLKNKISNLGFKKIKELKSWQVYKISKNFKVCIIPQLSSNSSEISESIQYDLDTSIVIQCLNTKKVFLNSVDNPFSEKDYLKIKKFIKSKFNSKINVMTIVFGAASEYPQSFLNINRTKEKKRIIKDSLVKIKSIINKLNPDITFQAGGTYLILGKFHRLNKYIAQPNAKEIYKFSNENNLDIVNIEGGGSIFFKNNLFHTNKIKKNQTISYMNEVLRKHKKIKYFYEKDLKLNLNKLDYLYEQSRLNYFRRLGKFNFKTSWKIEFYIYKNLCLNKDGKIRFIKNNILKKYYVDFCNKRKAKKNKEKKSNLICHIDYDLFFGFLTKKYVWNAPLSGSVVLFQRKPNFFDPNTTFSLNYLTI